MSGRDPGGRPTWPAVVRSPEEERRWRDLLEGNNPGYRFGRSLLRHLPGDTRCQLCAAPFHGPAAPAMRAIGKGAWPKNPKFCKSCFTAIAKHRGGAEVSCSLLFADVRDSTKLAEQMSATEFHLLMNRFFEAASRSLIDGDAIVDKFVGDEIIGIFVPAMTGDRHAARAIAAAEALIDGLPRVEGDRSLPVGAGVHTGIAFVGAVGSDTQVDVTAMGDPVNVAARLASAAGAGEILVSEEAARDAELDTSGLPRRALELKGKSEPVDVFVLG